MATDFAVQRRCHAGFAASVAGAHPGPQPPLAASFSSSYGSRRSCWRSSDRSRASGFALTRRRTEFGADHRQPRRSRAFGRRSDAGPLPGRDSAGAAPGSGPATISSPSTAFRSPRSSRSRSGGLARPHDATDTDYAMFTPIIEGGDESRVHAAPPLHGRHRARLHGQGRRAAYRPGGAARRAPPRYCSASSICCTCSPTRS